MKRAHEVVRLITAILLGIATGFDLARKVRGFVREECDQLSDEDVADIVRKQADRIRKSAERHTGGEST